MGKEKDVPNAAMAEDFHVVKLERYAMQLILRIHKHVEKVSNLKILKLVSLAVSVIVFT